MIIKRLLERKYSIVAIVWTISIAYLSLMSVKSLPSLFPFKFKDKIIHFTFYFVFVFLWHKAFQSKMNYLLKISLIAALYGIVIEVLQSTITIGREGDIFDVLANVLGVCFAVLFLKKNIL